MRCAASSASSRAGGEADPYEVLSIPQDASQDDIKRAYRRLALKWHPDRNPDNQAQAEKEFKRISKAYSLLSDPQQRIFYDKFGSQPGSAASASSQGRPFTEAEAAELFRQMFGNKPLHEIIREVEEAAEQQSEQMAAREAQLRDKADRLRTEIASLEASALQARNNPLTSAQLARMALMKAGELQQVEQALQQSWVQRVQQRSQARYALSRLRMLDPSVQLENRIRRALAWGAALGAYFLLGTSLLGSVFVFLGTSFGARLAFAVLKNARR